MDGEMVIVGDWELRVAYVTGLRSEQSDPDVESWLTADVTVRAERVDHVSISRDVEVYIGCWSVSDDDGDSWTIAHEGARVLAALLGIDSGQGLLGLMPVDCRDVGNMVCGAVRAAARE